MASASSLLSEEQFLCSICLDVFTDPVTTPCGHNYCNTCITHYWDTCDVCQCPLCKKTFDKRPQVFVNTLVSEMADHFRKSKPPKITSSTNLEAATSHEVSCDVCTETKRKALKSCLVCLSSYCETHLELHQRFTALKPHKLINPVKNLEDMMCKKHGRPLELFCKTDHTCVCQFCTESDHKLHQIVSVKEEYEEKAELGKTEAEVQQMIQERQVKIQEVKHSAELSKKDAEREMADIVQVFTALISCIERSQAELIGVIEEKQKTTEKQAEGFIKELEQEITELKKRSSELKQLSHTEDHLHLLQNFTSIRAHPPTKDWTKVHVHQSSHVESVRTAMSQLEKTINKEMEKELRNAELRRVQQYAVDVTLDPDTAHRNLILSENGKQVTHGDKENNVPDNAERFSKWLDVLGKQSFSSGRIYYEVQVKGKTEWTIGVVRRSIYRKGPVKLAPNNGHWAIWLRNGNEYKALADPRIRLPVQEEVQKVGVFVDYDEGLVSFYDVEARVHLYSFTDCTFTEKLYPYFSPEENNHGTNAAPLIITPISHTHRLD